MTTIIKLKRGLAADWAAFNPVLAPGEAGFEIDTHQVKVGDGITPYNGLSYIGGGAAALQSHIESELPHPIYDDGTSFLLRYENAKV